MQVIVTVVLALLLCGFVRAGEAPRPDDPPAVTVDLSESKPVPATPTTQRNDPEARARAAIDDLPTTHEPKDPPTPKPVTITTADPEFQRPRAIDPADAQPTAPQTQPAPPRRVQAGDPETRPRFTTPEDVGEAVKKGELSVLEAVTVRRTLAHDRPRFPMGEGLDSNAAAQLSSAKPAAAEPTAAEIETPKDPEEKPKPFDELVEQTRRNQRLVRELAGANEPKGPTSAETKIAERNAQAARLLEALVGDTQLTRIRGQITNATGKELLPARVRILDATNSPIDSPLPDGSYVRGDFAADVLPGLLKIEVHRSRFYSSSSTTLKAGGLMPPIAVPLSQPPHLNFAKQGWYLADLDIGLRSEPGERAVWRGGTPTLEDLELAAEAEGVQVLGVQVPRDDEVEMRNILERAASGVAGRNGVLVLPVFPGPRHVFQGVVSGLGVESAANLPWEVNDPSAPLHDAFEDIHAQGGLAVLKNFGGLGVADIKGDLLPLVPALRATNYFQDRDTRARLYAAAGLPFETVAGGGYDALAFDGSPSAERLWFSLLNQGHEIPIVGAGGGSLEGGRRPYGQTLVQCGPRLTRQSLLNGIQRGKTVVSFGPVVFARIADRDRGPGDWMPADGRPLTLQIQAYSSILPGMQLDKIEIIRNGTVLHTQIATEGESAISNLQWNFTEAHNAWYVLRVTERRNKADGATKGGTAWSSPLYFRSATHAAPPRAQSRVTGTLRSGAAPIKGTVTVVAPGEEEQQFETDADGRYSVLVPARAALVFSAPGCEPVAKRIFEHPDLQRKFGELQAERSGPLLDQLAKPATYSMWRLALAELEWNISLLKAK